MKKIDIPLYSDTLFTFCCVGLFSLCMFRFWKYPIWLSILLSILLGLLFACTVFFLKYFSHKRKNSTAFDREQKDKLMLHLALSSEGVVEKLLFPFSKKDFSCLFTMEPLSADNVATQIKRHGVDFILYCNQLSPSAEKLCRSFSITVYNGEDVYNLLKKENALPEKMICSSLKKKSWKDKRIITFSKKNSKPFFWSGGTLLLLSLLTPFPLYYLITGSILILASLLIKLFGYA